MPRLTLKQLAKELSLEYKGNPDQVLVGIAPLSTADSSQLSFCRSAKQAKLLSQTQAGAVIVSVKIAAEYKGNCLLADNPQQAFIDALYLLHPKPRKEASCHATAVVHPSVSLPKTASIGAHAVIEEGVIIGENVEIGSGCSIGSHCQLGDDVFLAPNVVLYRDVCIGNRVTIHASSVIGADGFGYHREGYSGPWQKVPQIGGVTIEDDVEIGASTTIDRGALTNTHIAKGAKIDNQVMIAHNVRIGEYTAIAGCSGVAGSSEIGKNCILAGHSGVADNLSITDNVILLGKAGVPKSIEEPGIYGSGTGLFTRVEWFKLMVHLRNLGKTIKKINKNVERVDG